MGCHLNRSISLTRTRRCSVETTPTRLVVDDDVAGLWNRIGRPSSHSERNDPVAQRPAGKQILLQLAPDIRNGFCYFAKGGLDGRIRTPGCVVD